MHYEEARQFVASIFDPKARETMRTDVRKEFVDFLSEIALGQTPFDLRAERWASMASEGVLALLDGNNDDLRLLSTIGLISSLSTGTKITLEALKKIGIQEADVARLAQNGLDIGVPLVILQDDVLIAVT